MRRLRVVSKKSGEGWNVKRGSKIVASGRKKTTTVKKAASIARKSTKPTSVRIHKRNGRIQEERTYPRRADPRRSKG